MIVTITIVINQEITNLCAMTITTRTTEAAEIRSPVAAIAIVHHRQDSQMTIGGEAAIITTSGIAATQHQRIAAIGTNPLITCSLTCRIETPLPRDSLIVLEAAVGCVVEDVGRLDQTTPACLDHLIAA